MMNSEINSIGRPWYREPWPWLLMLGPMVVVVAGVITAYLAVRSSDGLVEEDYYKQGLAVNQRTARDQHAASMGVEADLVVGDSGQGIRVLLHLKDAARLPEGLVLNIVHPTRPGLDQKLVLHRESHGVYGAALVPLRGRWHVTLEDDRQEWRLLGDWVTDSEQHLHLHAAPR